MNDTIFKAYDIRGIYPNEINEEHAKTIGRVCSSLFKSGKIIIARDGRFGGESLQKAVIDGLLQGAEQEKKSFEIVEVGLSTTPMYYFLVNTYEASGGMMITASHNPKEYNGIKIVKEKAIPVSGYEIKATLHE